MRCHGQSALAFWHQFRTELSREFPKLREVALELSGDLFHGFELRR
jgi:hypothetical protein